MKKVKNQKIGKKKDCRQSSSIGHNVTFCSPSLMVVFFWTKVIEDTTHNTHTHTDISIH
jgi:hypothetical protein